MNEPQAKTERNIELTREYNEKVKTHLIPVSKLAYKYDISSTRLYQIVNRQNKLNNKEN